MTHPLQVIGEVTKRGEFGGKPFRKSYSQAGGRRVWRPDGWVFQEEKIRNPMNVNGGPDDEAGTPGTLRSGRA